MWGVATENSSSQPTAMGLATLRISLLVLLLWQGSTAQAKSILHPSCTCERGILDCSNRDKSFLRPGEICNSVTRVDLSHNRLKLYPDGLSSAEIVKASDNKFTRLPSPPHLNTGTKILVMNNNEISETSQEFESLSSLERLVLRRNRLTSLEFLPRPCNLRDLDVDQNSISDLRGPLQDCFKLRFLSLGTNNLTSLQAAIFSQMKNLEVVSFRYNKLTSVEDGTFIGLNALKSLFLSDNVITTLSPHSFRGLSQLQRLYLSDNELDTLPGELFSHTPALERLEIGRNKLAQLPSNLLSGLGSLKLLFASKNRLIHLPAFSSCCDGLQQANFWNNSISAPGEEALRTALRVGAKLDLSGNPIHPSALRWALRGTGFAPFVRRRDSRCGGLRRGAAAVEFCVDVSHVRDPKVTDWMGAVRETMSNRV